MASRPLFNGSALVLVDNGQDEDALRLGYVFQVRTGTAISFPAHPTIISPVSANTAFQVEAGSPITLFWAARKVGTAAGGPTNDPQDAHIRIYNDDDDNDALTGAVFNSGNVLPGIIGNTNPSGSVVWTPATSGTFRIQLELRRGGGAFGPTSNDFRILSDGLHQFGGASLMTRALARDKGRLRVGTRINAIAITERGNAAPATFAFTGTEAVRVETTTSAAANKTTATETFRFRHRRNATSTIDFDAASAAQSTTVQRTETLVGDAWPAALFTYDTVAAVTNNSALHANNTRQYDALGGQAASGVWVHLVGVGTGLVLVDYATAERIASHAVDARVTAGHHFQRDDNTFGLSKHDASYSMLSTESGFVWTIIRNARSEGVNGVTVVQTLVPAKPGDTFTATATTTTQGGQAGVSGRLDWTASKPGGTWNKTSDITGPTSIDDNAYLLGATVVHTLLMLDPNVMPYTTLTVPDEASHAHPGDVLEFVLTIETKKTRTRIAVDAGSAFCSLVRFNVPLVRWEFLDTDDVTWVEWALGTARAQHPLIETPAGSRSYAHTFDTSTWGDTDVVSAAAHFKVDGTPYDDDVPRELVGRANNHSGGGDMTAQTTIA